MSLLPNDPSSGIYTTSPIVFKNNLDNAVVVNPQGIDFVSDLQGVPIEVKLTHDGFSHTGTENNVMTFANLFKTNLALQSVVVPPDASTFVVDGLLKASSAEILGSITCETPDPGDDSIKVATTGYVSNAIASIEKVPIVSSINLMINESPSYAPTPRVPPTDFLQLTNYLGWYHRNEVLGSKITWYIGQGSGFKVSDIKGLYFDMFNISTTSDNDAPFVSVYTKPTGVDDEIPGFAHSVQTYVPTGGIAIEGLYSCFVDISGEQPRPYAQSHLPKDMIAVATRGDYAPTEEILAIALGSNSASAVDTQNWVISKLGLCVEAGNCEYLLMPKKITESGLDAVLESGDTATDKGLNLVGGHGIIVKNDAGGTITSTTIPGNNRLFNGANGTLSMDVSGSGGKITYTPASETTSGLNISTGKVLGLIGANDVQISSTSGNISLNLPAITGKIHLNGNALNDSVNGVSVPSSNIDFYNVLVGGASGILQTTTETGLHNTNVIETLPGILINNGDKVSFVVKFNGYTASAQPTHFQLGYKLDTNVQTLFTYQAVSYSQLTNNNQEFSWSFAYTSVSDLDIRGFYIYTDATTDENSYSSCLMTVVRKDTVLSTETLFLTINQTDYKLPIIR
jgi:hypothetical protein